MANEKLQCQDTDIWLAITDHQRENNFMDLSKFTYVDIYVKDEEVGTPLLREGWKSNQPGGGIVENCVTTVPYSTPGNSWKDDSCMLTRCVACSIKANQIFVLRGLCENSM